MAPDTQSIDCNATFLTLGLALSHPFDGPIDHPSHTDSEVLSAAIKRVDQDDDDDDDDEEEEEDDDFNEEDDVDEDDEEEGWAGGCARASAGSATQIRQNRKRRWRREIILSCYLNKPSDAEGFQLSGRLRRVNCFF